MRRLFFLILLSIYDQISMKHADQLRLILAWQSFPQTKNITKAQRWLQYKYMQGFVGDNNVLPSFNEVKKSLETLRRAAPSIFTDEMIDNIHEIIAKRRLNEKIRNSIANDSGLYQPKTVLKMKAGKIKVEEDDEDEYEEKPNISSPQRDSSHLFAGKPRAVRHVPESKKNYTAELEQIWTKEHQKLLIDLFLQGLRISQIKDRFQLEYPQYKRIFNIKTIWCKYFRLVRVAFRHLENFINTSQQTNLPRLMKLNYSTRNSFVFDSSAQAGRMKVLEVYISKNVTNTLIRETIQAINKYRHEKNNQNDWK